MADDNLDKQFEEAFHEELNVDDTQPPVEPPTDEEKKDEQPAEEKKPEEPVSEPEKKAPEPPQTPPAEVPEQQPPAPLTRDDVRSIISDLRSEERTSGRELETTTNEVLEAYYPEGLSNTLIDESTGKPLRTPQDVVEASGDTMTTEEAAQWLMNEQYKLDRQVADIRQDAQRIAETTVKFKQDANIVLQRYDKLFKEYPHVQTKVWEHYHSLVKADKDKGVILSAPDMQKFYDDFLEPYRLAYEHSQNQPATQPTPPAAPEPPKPTADDRLDESGDGPASEVDDLNDFAQQVTKEMKRGE